MLAGTLFEDSEERASDTLTRAAFLMEAVAVGFDFADLATAQGPTHKGGRDAERCGCSGRPKKTAASCRQLGRCATGHVPEPLGCAE